MNFPVPSDVPMPHVGQIILIVAMTALALLAFGYAALESRRRRDLFLLFVVLGSGLAIPYEALGDDLVHVYYTELHQVTWIHTFGRDIPAFIGILYFWYLPFAAFALLRRSRTGVTAKQFWTFWLANLAFCIGFEMLVTSTLGHTWIYYGPQAFMVGDVPFFTPFTYVSFCTGIAAGVVGLERLLSRRQQWLVIPCIPMLMFASQGMTSLPLAVSLHGSSFNRLALDLGALGSAAFAVILAWLVSQAVRKPWATGASESIQPHDQLARAAA